MTHEQITAIATMIGAVEGFLWFALAVGVLIAFRKPAMRALMRVSEDGGTIDVFGVKVEIGQAAQQQQIFINELQERVGALQQKFDQSQLARAPDRQDGAETIVPESPAAATMLESSVAAPASNHPASEILQARILWNNEDFDKHSMFIASLVYRGFVVDEVRSVAEAVERFRPRYYTMVISGMRHGNDHTAGLQLTRDIRAKDAEVPIVIFTTKPLVARYAVQARAEGATAITDSAIELTTYLKTIQAHNR